MRLLALLFISSIAGLDSSAEVPLCDVKPISAIQELVPDFSGVDLAPKLNSKREAEIIAWWTDECPQFHQQKVKRYRQDNLICRVEGKSDQTLVIGAHYDKVSAGDGVADNWSGVVLLDTLMRHYKHNETVLSIEFVAFAGEEDGLFGSKAYVQQLQVPVTAMVNLDTLGLTDIIIDSGSDETLSCQTRDIARQLGTNLNSQRWRAVSSDWERFEAAGIPAIGLHSVNKRTVRRIHHKRDKAGNVDLKRLAEAYQPTRHLIDQLADQPP